MVLNLIGCVFNFCDFLLLIKCGDRCFIWEVYSNCVVFYGMVFVRIVFDICMRWVWVKRFGFCFIFLIKIFRILCIMFFFKSVLGRDIRGFKVCSFRIVCV